MSDDRPTLYTVSTRTQKAMGATVKRPRREWAELVVAVVLFATGLFVAIGTATMEVIGDSEPGPQFFPTIIATVLFATAIGVTIRTIRVVRATQTEPPHTDAARVGSAAQASSGDVADAASPDASTAADAVPRTDWRTLGTVVGVFIAFIVLLEPLGWLISAAGLFWALSCALGAKNPLRVLAVAFIFSALIQIAFSMGLGLSLPSGFIGAIF
jgi:putative tricarboxylic transport membrane protein